MGNWLFGSKKAKPNVTALDKATLDLKNQRDKLKQYQKKIGTVVERETQIAKQLLQQSKKKQALLALKKKKYQEGLLEKTDKMLMNLDEMVNSIEFAQMEKEIFDRLKSGNETLKEIHKEMSIEAVEQLMEDTQEAIQYQKDVSDILAGKLTQEDEDEVLKELEKIEQQQANIPQMPSVPKEVPVADIQEEPTRDETSEPAKKKLRKEQLVPA